MSEAWGSGPKQREASAKAYAHLYRAYRCLMLAAPQATLQGKLSRLWKGFEQVVGQDKALSMTAASRSDIADAEKEAKKNLVLASGSWAAVVERPPPVYTELNAICNEMFRIVHPPSTDEQPPFRSVQPRSTPEDDELETRGVAARTNHGQNGGYGSRSRVTKRDQQYWLDEFARLMRLCIHVFGKNKALKKQLQEAYAEYEPIYSSERLTPSKPQPNPSDDAACIQEIKLILQQLAGDPVKTTNINSVLKQFPRTRNDTDVRELFEFFKYITSKCENWKGTKQPLPPFSAFPNCLRKLKHVLYCCKKADEEGDAGAADMLKHAESALRSLEILQGFNFEETVWTTVYAGAEPLQEIDNALEYLFTESIEGGVSYLQLFLNVFQRENVDSVLPGSIMADMEKIREIRKQRSGGARSVSSRTTQLDSPAQIVPSKRSSATRGAAARASTRREPPARTENQKVFIGHALKLLQDCNNFWHSRSDQFFNLALDSAVQIYFIISGVRHAEADLQAPAAVVSNTETLNQILKDVEFIWGDPLAKKSTKLIQERLQIAGFASLDAGRLGDCCKDIIDKCKIIKAKIASGNEGDNPYIDDPYQSPMSVPSERKRPSSAPGGSAPKTSRVSVSTAAATQEKAEEELEDTAQALLANCLELHAVYKGVLLDQMLKNAEYLWGLFRLNGTLSKVAPAADGNCERIKAIVAKWQTKEGEKSKLEDLMEKARMEEDVISHASNILVQISRDCTSLGTQLEALENAPRTAKPASARSAPTFQQALAVLQAECANLCKKSNGELIDVNALKMWSAVENLQRVLKVEPSRVRHSKAQSLRRIQEIVLGWSGYVPGISPPKTVLVGILKEAGQDITQAPYIREYLNNILSVCDICVAQNKYEMQVSELLALCKGQWNSDVVPEDAVELESSARTLWRLVRQRTIFYSEAVRKEDEPEADQLQDDDTRLGCISGIIQELTSQDDQHPRGYADHWSKAGLAEDVNLSSLWESIRTYTEDIEKKLSPATYDGGSDVDMVDTEERDSLAAFRKDQLEQQVDTLKEHVQNLMDQDVGVQADKAWAAVKGLLKILRKPTKTSSVDQATAQKSWEQIQAIVRYWLDSTPNALEPVRIPDSEKDEVRENLRIIEAFSKTYESAVKHKQAAYEAQISRLVWLCRCLTGEGALRDNALNLQKLVHAHCLSRNAALLSVQEVQEGDLLDKCLDLIQAITGCDDEGPKQADLQLVQNALKAVLIDNTIAHLVLKYCQNIWDKCHSLRNPPEDPSSDVNNDDISDDDKD